MSGKITALPFNNNLKVEQSLNIQPTDHMKEIAERFNQLNNGLITVSEAVDISHSLGWMVQSFSLGEVRLVEKVSDKRLTILGISVEQQYSLVINYNQDGDIVNIKAYLTLFDLTGLM